MQMTAFLTEFTRLASKSSKAKQKKTLAAAKTAANDFKAKIAAVKAEIDATMVDLSVRQAKILQEDRRACDAAQFECQLLTPGGPAI
jgi:hypothetical protein